MILPALNSTEWRERALKAEAELDSLRAEKAEMLEAISLIEQRSKHAWTRMHCRALLAKANDPETDVQEALPTAAEVRGILK